MEIRSVGCGLEVADDCFFGATIDIASVERYVRTAHRGPLR
jgi:hypothetical protein